MQNPFAFRRIVPVRIDQNPFRQRKPLRTKIPHLRAVLFENRFVQPNVIRNHSVPSASVMQCVCMRNDLKIGGKRRIKGKMTVHAGQTADHRAGNRHPVTRGNQSCNSGNTCISVIGRNQNRLFRQFAAETDVIDEFRKRDRTISGILQCGQMFFKADCRNGKRIVGCFRRGEIVVHKNGNGNATVRWDSTGGQEKNSGQQKAKNFHKEPFLGRFGNGLSMYMPCCPIKYPETVPQIASKKRLAAFFRLFFFDFRHIGNHALRPETGLDHRNPDRQLDDI